MSCNPAIGGVAKGQIVREIDALGGEMGKVIDATGIQFRMLNRTKGPAMHSPRAQADKKLYQFTMKHRVEAQPNLTLRQEIVEGILLEDRPAMGPQSQCRAWSACVSRAATRFIAPAPSCSPPAPFSKPSCTPARPRRAAAGQATSPPRA